MRARCVNMLTSYGPTMSATSTETPMELTRNQPDLPVNILALVLADEYLFYTKTRDYHWNVSGPRFHDRHNFFKTQYEILDEKIDELAEFIHYFGQPAPASLSEFVKRARFKKDAVAVQASGVMVKSLLPDHELLHPSYEHGCCRY